MSDWHSAVDEALGALRAMVDDGASPSELLAEQFDRGLAWPRFAVGAGGLGVSAVDARAIRERVVGAGLPSSPASFVGLQQASALIHDIGSEVQRRRYLRRIFTGEDQWCQLFSEPGAGSDLANVGTRGRLEGDLWRFNGQKVWTSTARHASHAMLLARTDPIAPKHRGMTMFVLEMRQLGVKVRPLRQMDGGARFSEVFLSEATARDSDRLGDPGAGWAMSMHILNVERDGASELVLPSGTRDPRPGAFPSQVRRGVARRHRPPVDTGAPQFRIRAARVAPRRTVRRRRGWAESPRSWPASTPSGTRNCSRCYWAWRR